MQDDYELPLDFSRCFGEGCLIKDTCLRAKPPPFRQVWFSDFVSLLKDGELCEYFISIETPKQVLDK